jgi:hypothetical protein
VLRNALGLDCTVGRHAWPEPGTRVWRYVGFRHTVGIDANFIRSVAQSPSRETREQGKPPREGYSRARRSRAARVCGASSTRSARNNTAPRSRGSRQSSSRAASCTVGLRRGQARWIARPSPGCAPAVERTGSTKPAKRQHQPSRCWNSGKAPPTRSVCGRRLATGPSTQESLSAAQRPRSWPCRRSTSYVATRSSTSPRRRSTGEERTRRTGADE